MQISILSVNFKDQQYSTVQTIKKIYILLVKYQKHLKKSQNIYTGKIQMWSGSLATSSRCLHPDDSQNAHKGVYIHIKRQLKIRLQKRVEKFQ